MNMLVRVIKIIFLSVGFILPVWVWGFKVAAWNPGQDRAFNKEILGHGMHFADHESERLMLGKHAHAFVDSGFPSYLEDIVGHWPLHRAVTLGDVKGAKMLLEFGASIDSLDGNGVTPLYVAAAHASPKMVALLLGWGANPDAGDAIKRTPLHVAAYRGDVKVVTLLLNAKAEVNALTLSGETPLMLAAKEGHEAVVRLFLDLQDVDFYLRNTARSLAEERGHGEIVSLIDEKRLLVAAESGDIDVVELLLGSGVNPNAGNSVALFSAAYHGYDAMVEALVFAGVDLYARSGEGLFTALHVASQRGHAQTAALLIKGGADVNARTSAERTPLMIASTDGHGAVVVTLIRAGADLDASIGEGLFTALHMASQEGHAKVVTLLLGGGADMNARTSAGCTPLMLAAMKGDELIVAMLLHAGADFSFQSFNGMDARAWAMALGHSRVAELIDDAAD